MFHPGLFDDILAEYICWALPNLGASLESRALAAYFTYGTLYIHACCMHSKQDSCWDGAVRHLKPTGKNTRKLCLKTCKNGCQKNVWLQLTCESVNQSVNLRISADTAAVPLLKNLARAISLIVIIVTRVIVPYPVPKLFTVNLET